MARSLSFPKLKAGQLLELQRLLRSRSTAVGVRRRSELIWLLAGGSSLSEASEWADLHYTNAHLWVKRFLKSGVAGLSDRPKTGRPRLYGKDISTDQPKDLGLKFTTWSLPKLQEYLAQQPSMEKITRSTIRGPLC